MFNFVHQTFSKDLKCKIQHNCFLLETSVSQHWGVGRGVRPLEKKLPKNHIFLKTYSIYYLLHNIDATFTFLCASLFVKVWELEKPLYCDSCVQDCSLLLTCDIITLNKFSWIRTQLGSNLSLGKETEKKNPAKSLVFYQTPLPVSFFWTQ